MHNSTCSAWYTVHEKTIIFRSGPNKGWESPTRPIFITKKAWAYYGVKERGQSEYILCAKGIWMYQKYILKIQ